MNEIKDLGDSISEKNEEIIYYNLRRLMISIAWGDDSYKDLESVANALYDFLMGQKAMKDAYIEGN